ncbi:DUF4214 domain-containing protein [Mesobacterium sp. TK19101]|uniref:DUF4214 domain-containing protein n=1 Tax=Mesobacterium hydrothermale TaxID=3111907 RepID=A0ABU6HLG8_9RHOB|nr:DUF4214 domain-containing protein [Mesobacterium sp. TK19101]MEC3863212.1 DUF4214 domain-containing protein [Mesobacterium sp. TK19101]
MTLSFTPDLIPTTEVTAVSTDGFDVWNLDIATLTDGGYVIAWGSAWQDGSGRGIYAQRYDAQGATVGTEFRVNTHTADDQILPAASGLLDGGFVISWNSLVPGAIWGLSGVFGQLYDATGATVGSEFLVNTTPLALRDVATSTVGLSNGGYAIFWTGTDSDGFGVFAQLFDATGASTGAEFQINTEETNNQSDIKATTLSDGGFVAIWTSSAQRTYAAEVVGQRFDVSGAKVGTEFRVNTYRYGSQTVQGIEPLEDGGFVAIWEGPETTLDKPGYWGQRFDANGDRVGMEFQVLRTVPDSLGLGLTTKSERLEDGSIQFISNLVDRSASDWHNKVYTQRFVEDTDALYVGDGLQLYQAPGIPGQVFRLYHAALDRNPDHSGFLNWVGQLERGADVVDIANGFANSAEFLATYGVLTDAQYVEQLYLNVLGRAPDSGGLSDWLGALAGGATRAQVLIGFSQSQEFQNATALAAMQYARTYDPASWTDEVFRMYQAGLERAPDPLGFTKFTWYLAHGTTMLEVMEEFVASPEFRPAYDDMTNADFVAALYQNILGRAVDAGGLTGWTAALDGGASRAQIVLAIAESAEFIAMQADPLEVWMRGHGPQVPLDGGPGNDTLTGGIGADVFVFDAADAGDNVVLDLEPWDTLHFTGFGYASDGDARSHMTQSGANVLFADQGVSVTLLGVQMGQIDDDIILV